jgi:hypothetical protein
MDQARVEQSRQATVAGQSLRCALSLPPRNREAPRAFFDIGA